MHRIRTHTIMSCLSFIGDKALNTWHLIIWKREWEWNIWEIYLHASHLPDSLKSHAQSSALLSAQRITQTVCMNNGHTLNPRCAKGKKEEEDKERRRELNSLRGTDNWDTEGDRIELQLAWSGAHFKGMMADIQTCTARVKYLFLDQCADEKQ